MASICFYFQVHQPNRLRHYTFFDRDSNYFDDLKNAALCRKVSDKCYLPANQLMLELIEKYKGKFKISYSITGVLLEQFKRYAPEVITSFQKLANTDCVEFLGETYYHSLAFLYSKEEFIEQINQHRKTIKQLFGKTPRVFRNTELVYNNDLASVIEEVGGFEGIITEGADDILGYRSPNFVYRPVNSTRLKLLLKNYRLSDDIAFRFSNRGWRDWPLTADKFSGWVSNVNGCGYVVNLFMDYETFGEHQWQETGIFEFMRHLPDEILKHPDNNFKTPTEAVKAYEAVDSIDVPRTISWADIERDLSAWRGNAMQDNALAELYQLRNKVVRSEDPEIIDDWRKLQTSDHFYYMCTKWFADGDVHKYFNPYNSPYDAYINFMNVLDNLDFRCARAIADKQLYYAAAEKTAQAQNAGYTGKVCFSENSVLPQNL